MELIGWAVSVKCSPSIIVMYKTKEEAESSIQDWQRNIVEVRAVYDPFPKRKKRRKYGKTR